jgi:hypothetical protein
MRKTIIVIQPPCTGIWPDGEPKSVRDAADERQEIMGLTTAESAELIRLKLSIEALENAIAHGEALQALDRLCGKYGIR